MAGRPTRLVADVQSKVVQYLRIGLALETAARAAGVSHAALYNWLDKGSDEAECSNPNTCDLAGKHAVGECPANVQYRDFVDAAGQAKSEFQVAMASIVVRGAQGVQKKDGQGKAMVDASGAPIWVREPEPRWALEMLARRAPGDWKGVMGVEMDAKAGLPFVIEIVQHDRPEHEVRELMGASYVPPAIVETTARVEEDEDD